MRDEETRLKWVASNLYRLVGHDERKYFPLEPALTNAEHHARRDVMETGSYDEAGSTISEAAASAVVTPLRWERSADIGRPASDERGFSARDGSQDIVDVLRKSEGSESGAEASKEVNQSLARIEMNSLEVKLFLDSIDQRISRMEPRLEEMRGGEASPPPLDTESKASVGAGEEPPIEKTELPVIEESSLPGPTAERRRRAQGVPEERRRSPHAVPLEVPEEEVVSWDMAHVVTFVRRRWIPIVAIALLTLMMLVFLGSGSRSQRRDAVNSVGTVPVAATGAAAKPKDSADVPWATGTGMEQGGSERTDASGAGRRAVAGHSVVVEQGVVVPQLMTAARAPAPAPAQSNLSTPSVAAVKATEAGTDNGAGVAPASPNGVAFREDAATDGMSGSTAAAVAPGSGAPAGRIIAPASRRVNVSSGVMAGNLLYSPRPAYPRGFATLFHPQGEVVMQAIISKRGKVANLHVISGHYMLRGAAKDAVRTWRYRPYTVNGAPVEVATIVSVEFHR